MSDIKKKFDVCARWILVMLISMSALTATAGERKLTDEYLKNTQWVTIMNDGLCDFTIFRFVQDQYRIVLNLGYLGEEKVFDVTEPAVTFGDQPEDTILQGKAEDGTKIRFTTHRDSKKKVVVTLTVYDENGGVSYQEDINANQVLFFAGTNVYAKTKDVKKGIKYYRKWLNENMF